MWERRRFKLLASFSDGRRQFRRRKARVDGMQGPAPSSDNKALGVLPENPEEYQCLLWGQSW